MSLRERPALFAATLTAALAALVGWLAGFAPSVPVLYGLAAVGPVVDSGLPAARVAAIGTAAAGVSHLLTAAVFAPGAPEGTVTARGYASLRAARWWWLAQGLASTTVAVLTVAENAGLPAARLFADPAAVLIGLEQIQPASGWLVSAGVALLVAVGAGCTLSWRGSVGLLLLGLAALLPASLTASTDAERSHDIAGDALALHVVASVLWLASTIAMATWRGDWAGKDVVHRRHTAIAGCCLPVVAGSGLVSAAYAVSPEHLIGSGYGVLAVASALVLLVVAIVVLARVRSYLRAPAGSPVGLGARETARLHRLGKLPAAALELLLLVVAAGLGTGLTRLLPPAEAGYEASRYVYLIGYDLPVPAKALDLLIRWRPDLVFGPLSVLGAAFYLAGVRRVRRAGRLWSAGRTAAWMAGCTLLLLATCSGLAAYAPAIFSVHMVQHMVLATFVPVLLVLGHGVTLAVDASGPVVRARLLSLLDSSAIRLVSGPLVAWTAVAATLFGLYPTGLFADILQQHWAHLAMDTAFLCTGLAVFWPVLGLMSERAGRGLPAVAKVVLVFALMALHAGFSVWLLTRADPVAGAFYGAIKPALRPGLLADQHLGAILGWALAEVPVLIAVIALFRRWSTEDRTMTPRPSARDLVR